MLPGMNDSTPITPLSADTVANLRVAHLQMVQGVIARMSGYSASVKTFAVTIVAGLLAYYSQRPDDRVYLFAVGSVIVLGLLDTHYLRCEKGFRKLFDDLRAEPITANTDFRIDSALTREFSVSSVARSWSVSAFYLPLLLGLAVLFLVLKVWPV